MQTYKFPVLKQITINAIEEKPPMVRDIFMYVNVEVKANSFHEAWNKYLNGNVTKKEYGEVIYRNRREISPEELTELLKR